MNIREIAAEIKWMRYLRGIAASQVAAACNITVDRYLAIEEAADDLLVSELIDIVSYHGQNLYYFFKIPADWHKRILPPDGI